MRSPFNIHLRQVGLAIALLISQGGTSAITQPPPTSSVDPFEAGIVMPDGSRISLEPLVVRPEQSVLQRQAKLAELSGRIDVKQFTRQSIQAPVMIQLSPIQDQQGNRLAHRLHSAFVAYAPLEKLRDDQLLKQVFGGAMDEAVPKAAERQVEGPSKEIPADVLEQLAVERPGDTERFQFVSFPLLNEVEVKGTLYVRRTEGEDWIQLDWLLDPRFEAAGEYANRWSKETRDELGQAVRTEPLPYTGMGGRLMVSVTDAENDQLLFESRMVLHEPEDWFTGDNFLRAKLPLAIQENARNFRRELTTAKRK